MSAQGNFYDFPPNTLAGLHSSQVLIFAEWNSY